VRFSALGHFQINPSGSYSNADFPPLPYIMLEALTNVVFYRFMGTAAYKMFKKLNA